MIFGVSRKVFTPMHSSVFPEVDCCGFLQFDSAFPEVHSSFHDVELEEADHDELS